MLPRESVVRPLGLITQRNKYGQYPAGALSQAVNVCLRNPGIIEAIPSRTLYNDIPGGADMRRVFAVGDRFLVLLESGGGAWTAYWVTGSAASAISMPTGFTLDFDEGVARVSQSRGRVFLTTANGVLAFDSVGDTTPRIAGLPMPSMLRMNSTTTANASVFSNTDRARYRAVFRRVYSDGYVLRSVPSNSFDYNHVTVSTVDLVARIEFGNPSVYNALVVGDYVDLYRTDVVTANADPGETYRFVASHTINSSDIIAQVATIEDHVQDNALGEELYTDSGQVDNGANFGPALADDAFAFKGFMFYAQTDENAFFRLRIPGMFGILSWSAVGDTTLGNNTITNVVHYGVVPIITTGARIVGPGIPADTTITGVGAGTITMSANATANAVGVNVAYGQDADTANGVGFRQTIGDRTIGSPTLTNVLNMRGVAVGQLVQGTGIPANTTITAVGGTTITLSANATSTGASAMFIIYDRMEINGTAFELIELNTLFSTLAASAGAYDVQLLADRAVTRNSIVSWGDNENGVDLVFRVPFYNVGTISIEATNGTHYSPNLPAIGGTAATSTTDPRSNRLVWSKADQPEAVPPATAGQISELLYGDGTHYRAIVRRDSVLLFASDGAWILTGDGGDWRVDLLDPDCVLTARDAACILDGMVYAYTNNGFVRITDGNAVEPISKGLIGDLIPGAAFDDTWLQFMAANEVDNEVWFFHDEETTYVWNSLTKSFVTNTEEAFQDYTTAHFTYSPHERNMFFGIDGYGEGLDPALLEFSDEADEYRPDYAVDYQPLTGDGDPFTLKQFVDCDFLFQTAPSGYDLVSRINGATAQEMSLVSDGYDWRAKSGIGRDWALAPRVAPGFEASDDTTLTEVWRFFGVSTRFTVQSSEVRR